jgi:hypothetical protein
LSEQRFFDPVMIKSNELVVTVLRAAQLSWTRCMLQFSLSKTPSSSSLISVPESTTSAILWGTEEGAKDAPPHRVTVPPKTQFCDRPDSLAQDASKQIPF